MSTQKAYHAGKALGYIAGRVHESFASYSKEDQEYLLLRTTWTGITIDAAAIIDKNRVVAEIEHALAVGLAAWRRRAPKEGFPLYHEGRLSCAGQLEVLSHLPIAPMEYGTPEFIDAICVYADYYYRWRWTDLWQRPIEYLTYRRNRHYVRESALQLLMSRMGYAIKKA